MADHSLITVARFWSKVDVGPKSQCWPWRGATEKRGYGRFKIDGRLVLPHRFAYELAHGPIPEGTGYHGTVIRHACDNPSCCNPWHVAAGTQADNVADMDKRGRRRVVAKPRKITDEQIATIRHDPRTEREIAVAYGISKGYIHSIRHGKLRKVGASTAPIASPAQSHHS